ncbi:flavin-containing monooxygenase [Rhodococcus kronopolitis]|uniref:Flavin-containing monooxygenase n=1 Tax=Rhodococcus kronopolitis TaxID=1460226 RepID=A0ABV9FRZ3_9NOCA
MSYMVKARHRAPAQHAQLTPDPNLPRVCVIGAGSSGITAAKALYGARVPFECYEQGPVVGGNWVYENPNGLSACYDTLEINTSCPRMAYSDFPMPQDYPAYAKHHQVAAYFRDYVEHFGFGGRLTFSTTVEKVERDADGRWSVTVTGPDGTRTEEFDAVVVATGHHWDPRLPEPAYPGSFDGEQIHSHDYRSADQLDGRDVVVVGAGNSAMDIAVAASECARSASISQRRGEWVLRKFAFGRPSDQIALPGWLPWWVTSARLAFGAAISGNVAKLGLPQPEHRPGQSHPVQSEGIRDALRSARLTPRPGIERLDGDRVVFVDGSSAPADLIVWATGYRVSFPFLDPDLLSVEDNDLPLWKRTVHPDLPGLYFVGLLQPVGAIMPLAEAQGAWITEMVRGVYVAPDGAEVRAQMTRDDQLYKKRFYKSARHTMEVDFDHYLWDLRRERRRGARRAGAAVAETVKLG